MGRKEELHLSSKCKQFQDYYYLAVSYMLTLKDLPIFVSSRNTNHKCKPAFLDPIQLIKKKAFRMSEQNRKQRISSLCEARLSHKTILDQPEAKCKMNRRISTAGTSKRFPKDFFKMQDDIKNDDKSPKFVLKFTKKELQNSIRNANKSVLGKNGQEINQLQQKQEKQEKQGQKTPKFKEPETEFDASKEVNQFLLLEGENKFLKPFLSLDGIGEGEKTSTGKPLKFLKKVKKGQILKQQNRINRTLSQHEYGDANILNVNKIRGCCY